MNIRNSILLSLLIGGLTFQATAQKNKPTNEETTQQVGPEAQVQPPLENGDENYKGDVQSPDENGDVSGPDGEQSQADELHLQLDGKVLRVTGGSSGKIAILLGLEKKTFPLQGGAQLLLDPLAILVQGQLDEEGEFEIRLTLDTESPAIEPIKFYAQAISQSDDTGDFSTSSLLELEFDGTTVYETEEVGMVHVPTWVPEAQTAIRRQLVA